MPSRLDTHNRLLLTLHRATPYLLTVLFATAIIALYKARLIVLATLIGIGGGVLLTPVVSALHSRLRLPRPAGAAVLAVVILAGAGGIAYIATHLVSSQIGPLLETLPAKLESARAELSSTLKDIPFLAGALEKANFASLGRSTLGRAFRSVQTTLLALGLFIYVVALAVYVAATPQRYRDGMLTILPAYSRPRARSVLDDSGSELRRWFLAQLVSMSFVGILSALGLWLTGVEQWLLLGVLSAVLEFIPYAGPVVAGMTAAGLTLASQPSMVPWVILIYIGIQQAEGNVITPLVLKKGASLPPVHLLFLGTVLGSLFGVLGVFVAAPFLTVTRAIYLRTIAEMMDQMRAPPRGVPYRRLDRTGS